MAHSFDTGRPRAQRTLIRDRAVTLLSGLLRANGGYLQAVAPFGGVVRSYQDPPEIIDELWNTLNGRAPAIAIALGDWAGGAAGMGGFNLKGDLELLVYFFTNHARDLELGRHSIDAVALASDTADPGLDVMMEHASELLIGQYGDVSPTIKQLRLNREEEIRTELGFALWVQRYAITVTRTINPHRGVTQLLEEFRSMVRTTDLEMEPPAPPVVDFENTLD